MREHFGMIALGENPLVLTGHGRVVTLFKILAHDAGSRPHMDRTDPPGDDELGVAVVGGEAFLHLRHAFIGRAVAGGILAVVGTGRLQKSDRIHGPVRGKLNPRHRPSGKNIGAVDIFPAQHRFVDISALGRRIGHHPDGGPVGDQRNIRGDAGVCAARAAFGQPEAGTSTQTPAVDELVKTAQVHAAMAQRARSAEESQQRLALALETYEKALDAGAGSPLVLNPMAQLYLLSGNTERAVSLYHRSLAEDPQRLATYSGLNDAFFTLGRLDSSVHYVEAARQIAPDNAGVSLCFSNNR